MMMPTVFSTGRLAGGLCAVQQKSIETSVMWQLSPAEGLAAA